MRRAAQASGEFVNLESVGVHTIEHAHAFVARHGNHLNDRLKKSLLKQFSDHRDLPELRARLDALRAN